MINNLNDKQEGHERQMRVSPISAPATAYARPAISNVMVSAEERIVISDSRKRTLRYEWETPFWPSSPGVRIEPFRPSSHSTLMLQEEKSRSGPQEEKSRPGPQEEKSRPGPQEKNGIGSDVFELYPLEYENGEYVMSIGVSDAIGIESIHKIHMTVDFEHETAPEMESLTVNGRLLSAGETLLIDSGDEREVRFAVTEPEIYYQAVAYLNDQECRVSSYTPGTGRFTLNPLPFVNGEYLLKITLFGRRGNTRTYEIPVRVDFEHVLGSPSIKNVMFKGEPLEENSTILINDMNERSIWFEVEDTSPSVRVTKVYPSESGGGWINHYPDGYRYDFGALSLDDGAHALTFVATNAYGLRDEFSVNIVVEVDRGTEKPAFYDVSFNGSPLAEGEAITIRGYQDWDSLQFRVLSPTLSYLQAWLGNWGLSLSPNLEGFYVLDHFMGGRYFTNLPNGEYVLRILTADSSNNKGILDIPVVVNFEHDVTPSLISDITVDGSPLAEGEAIVFTDPRKKQVCLTVTDDNFERLEVYFDNGSGPPGFGFTPQGDSQFAISIDSYQVPNGEHTLTVYAVDMAGNATSLDIPLIFDFVRDISALRVKDVALLEGYTLPEDPAEIENREKTFFAEGDLLSVSPARRHIVFKVANADEVWFVYVRQLADGQSSYEFPREYGNGRYAVSLPEQGETAAEGNVVQLLVGGREDNVSVFTFRYVMDDWAQS